MTNGKTIALTRWTFVGKVMSLLFFFKFYFIFKLYNIVLVLPNIEMNPPQWISLLLKPMKVVADLISFKNIK